MRYDANDRPHSATWLELDENERIDAVMDYHRRAGVKLENLKLHAITHVVVENQVALGEPTPVPATLNRLMHEGLDRHEAIHAIGSILMGIVSDVSRDPDIGGDINARYSRELAKLTAAGWRLQVE
jgi:hypothetical protein